jgi:hypothetical protein
MLFLLMLLARMAISGALAPIREPEHAAGSAAFTLIIIAPDKSSMQILFLSTTLLPWIIRTWNYYKN